VTLERAAPGDIYPSYATGDAICPSTCMFPQNNNNNNNRAVLF